MKNLVCVFLLALTFLFSSKSFSQDYKYQFSKGIHYAELKTSTHISDTTLKINVLGMLVYETAIPQYFIGVGFEEVNLYCFDIVNNVFSVEVGDESFNYQLAPGHVANDLTAFAFIVPANDLLKFNEAKEVILNVVLLKSGKDAKKEEIPMKINLKPNLTTVYLDFYNFGIEKKQ